MQYHGLCVLFVLFGGIGWLILSYYLGASSGASICLVLAAEFGISFLCRKVRG
jgi:ABC-type Mn2+/Zn2+ transport system permease subunit